MTGSEQEKLVSISRLMAKACLAAMILLPVGYLMRWFNVIEAHEVMGVHGSNTFIHSPETSTFKRLVGFALSMVPQTALLYGLFRLRQLFMSIDARHVFGERAADHMRGFARALLAFAVLDFVMTAPLSAWVTWDNPPGERMIQISVGEGALQTYFLIALFFALTRVMAEGIRLARENAEFV